MENKFFQRQFTQLNNQNAGLTISDKTYVLEDYVAYDKPVLYVNQHGHYVVHSKYKSPEWLFKRYTSCYSHLYIIENTKDLLSAIRYHFVDFDLRRESPNYVIFWDLFDIRNSYKSLFAHQEFHGTFMDYRLVIRKSTKTSLFDVSLVCIICAVHIPQGLVTDPVTPPTVSNIHQVQKQVHSNHFGLQELACFLCMLTFNDTKLDYRLQPLYLVMAGLTNISIFYLWDEFNFTSLTTMTHTYYVRPESIQRHILDRRYPSFIMSISHAYEFEYKMFTVVHKSLLAPSGLTGLVSPLYLSTPHPE